MITKRRTTIGWREWARLPDLGVDRIMAKIDTGAKSSAIHAFKLKEHQIDGALYAEFYLHPERDSETPQIFCRAPIIDHRLIRSSNGQEEERPVIETRLGLGGRAWKIALAPTNRDQMSYRLLLGRDALSGKFVVDPSASFLLGE